MQLGYSTWGMPTAPIDVAIQHLAQLGFDGIELTVIPGYSTELSRLDTDERARIRRLLREHNLALPAIAAHTSLLEADAEVHTQNMQRLQDSVNLAVDLAQGDSPPVVNTTAGSRPEPWAEIKPILVERTAELVAYAQPRGVTIAMEPHVHFAIDTPAQLLELLDLVASPYLKVNFDISHFDVMGMTLEETAPLLAPHSVHTHVKDQRGRVPDFEFLIPGEGDFDYVAYLQAMQAHGYAGFITVEVSIFVQRRPDYDPLAAATQSYQTLSRAFREAGIERSRHSK